MSAVSQRRPLWILLVLPGFLLRALVAPGFMPMSGPGSALTMQACPGHAAAGASTPMPAGRQPADDRQEPESAREAPCAYAVTAGGGPAAASVAFFAANPPEFFVAAPVALQQRFERLAPRQFPPRGPPFPGA